MKPAEFTDHASAAAFIAAGRKSGERATADGWNTVLYQEGSDFVLQLHGAEIVRYTAGGRTDITIPMRNHVVADRIQRYGLADQFQLVTSTKQWGVSAKWGELPGIEAPQSIWIPVVDDVGSVITVIGGAMVAPAPKTMPTVLTAGERQRIFKPAIKQWLNRAMKTLDGGFEFDANEWRQCPLCMPVEVPGKPMVGQLAMDVRHLMSHTLEGIVLPAMVVGLAGSQWGSFPHLNATIDAAGNGSMGAGAAGRYNRDVVRRTLRNALTNSLTRY